MCTSPISYPAYAGCLLISLLLSLLDRHCHQVNLWHRLGHANVILASCQPHQRKLFVSIQEEAGILIAFTAFFNYFLLLPFFPGLAIPSKSPGKAQTVISGWGLVFLADLVCSWRQRGRERGREREEEREREKGRQVDI
jgi:hypothetical protein